MNAIYLMRQNNEEILVTDVVSIINKLPGIIDLQRKNRHGEMMVADYMFEDDRTLIRLDKEQRTITITGIGKASIQAAFEIQSRYAHPLRMFDMDYSFDFILRGIRSVGKLEKMMRDGTKTAESE